MVTLAYKLTLNGSPTEPCLGWGSHCLIGNLKIKRKVWHIVEKYNGEVEILALLLSYLQASEFKRLCIGISMTLEVSGPWPVWAECSDKEASQSAGIETAGMLSKVKRDPHVNGWL